MAHNLRIQLISELGVPVADEHGTLRPRACPFRVLTQVADHL